MLHYVIHLLCTKWFKLMHVCFITDALFSDKLDGLIHHNKKIAPVHQSIEEFLQLPDDYDSRPLAPGQKRVS